MSDCKCPECGQELPRCPTCGQRVEKAVEGVSDAQFAEILAKLREIREVLQPSRYWRYYYPWYTTTTIEAAPQGGPPYILHEQGTCTYAGVD